MKIAAVARSSTLRGGRKSRHSFMAQQSILVNFVIGGISMFIMRWIYFNFVGNAKVKDARQSPLVKWWLAHLGLMLCGVMVGVALAAKVKVGFWEPYPRRSAAIGCFGLAGYIAMLWTLQHVVEHRLSGEL